MKLPEISSRLQDHLKVGIMEGTAHSVLQLCLIFGETKAKLESYLKGAPKHRERHRKPIWHRPHPLSELPNVARALYTSTAIEV
jgi:hypothetical protein